MTVSTAGRTPLPAHYALAWRDEFDSPTLDPRKWAYEWEGQRDAAWQTPEAVSIRDSCLAVSCREQDGRWISGGVCTKELYTPRYGYFEARIKFPGLSCKQFWGAFWLWTANYGEYLGGRQSGTEMDVAESFRLTQGLIHQGVHWDGYGPAHKEDSHDSLIADPFGWHTYGMLWEPARVVFYIDNAETFRPSKALISTNPRQFMRLTCHLLDPAAGGGEMLVDWVRVWQAQPITGARMAVKAPGLTPSK